MLRDQLAIPPVGDIRRCLAALADDETLVGEVLEYRFAGSPTDPTPGGAAARSAATRSATSCSRR